MATAWLGSRTLTLIIGVTTRTGSPNLFRLLGL